MAIGGRVETGLGRLSASEVIFEVAESADGVYEACALGDSIFFTREDD